MPSMTFPVKTSFVLNWTLKDTQDPPQPINGATVTATLYAGRSLRDPNGTPGTPVVPISGLVLPFVSAGLYSTTVPGTLDPPLDGVGYVLVVDGQLSAVQIYHAEQPVVIETAGDSIDLTTVDLVKARAQVTSNSEDDEIQAAVTGFSKYVLRYTGQASLNSILSHDEFYDGNGNNKLYLRNYPILSLNTVKIYGTVIPISTQPTAWGVYIGQSGKYIGLRGWLGNFTAFPYPMPPMYVGSNRNPAFLRGAANVEVDYTAGYADTPPDLEYAVRCIVAINYKRKGWQDQAARTVTGGGTSNTTRYQAWEWPPEYACIIEQYKRMAIIQ